MQTDQHAHIPDNTRAKNMPTAIETAQNTFNEQPGYHPRTKMNPYPQAKQPIASDKSYTPIHRITNYLAKQIQQLSQRNDTNGASTMLTHRSILKSLFKAITRRPIPVAQPRHHQVNQQKHVASLWRSLRVGLIVLPKTITNAIVVENKIN